MYALRVCADQSYINNLRVSRVIICHLRIPAVSGVQFLRAALERFISGWEQQHSILEVVMHLKICV